MPVRLIQGDCLTEMARLEAGSVDMILCDLPYGTTACSWDAVIPFEPLWREYRRLIRGNGAIVLTASQPFTTALIASNYEMFKYCWYWRKSRPAGFTNAKLKPLKDIEDVVVFSEGMTANGSRNNMPYFPQGVETINKEWKRPTRYMSGDKGVNPARAGHSLTRTLTATGYPRQVLDFANPNSDVLHPTQKPVALMEYLIRTYTNPGDTVLDNTCGSGTTLVAAINTGRNAIGIERDPDYFRIAQERVRAAQPRLVVDLAAFRRVAEWNKRVRSFQGAAA
jgi:site-specific DNA-methyltransferase (adenine-specific)